MTRSSRFADGCPVEVGAEGEHMTIVSWKWGEKQTRKMQTTLVMDDWQVIRLLRDIRKYCAERANTHRQRAVRLDNAWKETEE